MKGVLPIAGAVWIAAVAVCVGTAIAGGASVVVPGYFAGWLLAVSLPLGALPILMVQDLTDAPETPTRAMLRLLLASLPLVALLVVPALFDLGAIFPWHPGSRLSPPSPLGGLARSWYEPAAFGLRTIVYLVFWSVLALFFVRPAPVSQRHRTIAGAGLALHAVIGTLAAFDWWMSLDKGFVSSAYGFVVVAGQAAFALAVAALAAALTKGAAPERSTVKVLLALLGIAAFVQFSQYLVVWSANLPKEIIWYQARSGALGSLGVLGLPVLLAIVFALLMPPPLSAMRRPALVALAGIVLVAFVDLAGLASSHGSFTFAGLGLVLAVLIVLGGLGTACALALGGRLSRKSDMIEPRHG